MIIDVRKINAEERTNLDVCSPKQRRPVGVWRISVAKLICSFCPRNQGRYSRSATEQGLATLANYYTLTRRLSFGTLVDHKINAACWGNVLSEAVAATASRCCGSGNLETWNVQTLFRLECQAGAGKLGWQAAGQLCADGASPCSAKTKDAAQIARPYSSLPQSYVKLSLLRK